VVVRFKTYGASSARVIVGYGRHEDLEKTVIYPRASFRLPFHPDTAGHVLVLLQDEGKNVFSALGLDLKAGNLSYRRRR
jgi:hypothetical protein